MSFARETEAKINEIHLVEPREIVTAFLMHWRKPIVAQAQEFLQNPNESAFTMVWRKLCALLDGKNLKEWSLLIEDLIKKQNSKTITPRELLLIGIAYLVGKGVTKDFHIAFNCFTEAKNISSDPQVTSIALTYLAIMHCYGWARPASEAEAIRLYQEAIEKGGKWALARLGLTLNQQDILLDGIQQGIAEAYCGRGRHLLELAQFEQAYGCHVKAALQGLPWSIGSLAVMYEKGNCLKQDKDQAALFFRLAASRITRFTPVGIVGEQKACHEKILAISNDTPKKSRYFIEYQLAILNKDKAKCSKLAKQNSSEFLKYVTDSCDLWDEVSPLLKGEVLATIEKSLMQAVSVLRNAGINADVTTMILNYLWPEDLNKAVISSENKCRVKELDDQVINREKDVALQAAKRERERLLQTINREKEMALQAAKREREMLLQAERREQQSASFDKSVAALIARKGRNVVRADSERTQDLWHWARPSPDTRKAKR